MESAPSPEQVIALLKELSPQQRREVLLWLAREGRIEDRETYRRLPVAEGEFTSGTPDPMSWEAEGWDEFDPAR